MLRLGGTQKIIWLNWVKKNLVKKKTGLIGQQQKNSAILEKIEENGMDKSYNSISFTSLLTFLCSVCWSLTFSKS